MECKQLVYTNNAEGKEIRVLYLRNLSSRLLCTHVEQANKDPPKAGPGRLRRRQGWESGAESDERQEAGNEKAE